MRFEGKVALVTGGASGIGRASAAAFAREGAMVATSLRSPSRQRFHNGTGTGELTTPGGSQPKARVYYQAIYPDALDRIQAEANYGTNGATALSRPATIPARSETVLDKMREMPFALESIGGIAPSRDDKINLPLLFVSPEVKPGHGNRSRISSTRCSHSSPWSPLRNESHPRAWHTNPVSKA